jgi:pyridoxamine 5'-phosphate oxidase
MELKDYRRQYTKGGLREASMPDDPLVLFEQWQRDASMAGLADPTGVVVATVQPDGSIRQRFVLLRASVRTGLFSLPITTATRQRH